MTLGILPRWVLRISNPYYKDPKVRYPNFRKVPHDLPEAELSCGLALFQKLRSSRGFGDLAQEVFYTG